VPALQVEVSTLGVPNFEARTEALVLGHAVERIKDEGSERSAVLETPCSLRADLVLDEVDLPLENVSFSRLSLLKALASLFLRNLLALVIIVLSFAL